MIGSCIEHIRFEMVGQFEKMQSVWLIWPRNPNTWRDGAAPARAAFANFIKLIAKETSLKACVRHRCSRSSCTKALLRNAAFW